MWPKSSSESNSSPSRIPPVFGQHLGTLNKHETNIYILAGGDISCSNLKDSKRLVGELTMILGL
jgi:hypothetical protein